MNYAQFLAAGTIMCLAGAVVAQPTMDGKLDPQYGPIQWIQTQPTSFGDNVPCVAASTILVALNNSNRAGVLGTTPVVAANQTAAAAVTTGFEIQIPLSDLGNPTTLKLIGFVTSQDYSNFSSQAIPGIGANTTLGGYPSTSTVNLGLASGTRYVTIPLAPGSSVPTVDGTLDASFYGAALAVQDTTTNYGDATAAPTNGLYDCVGGSEVDAVYAKVGNDGNLYVFVSGNLEANYNKLVLLFDNGSANGQNPLTNTTNNNGSITGGGPNALAGMALGANFNACYFMSFTVSPAPQTLYVDFAKIGTQAQQGATRSLNPSGATTNPFTSQVCAASQDVATGSEIDGLYATVCGNYLYLFIPGNLETNGNYLDLFFDVGTTQVPVPGSTGQNRISPNNVTVGNGALERMAEDSTNPILSPGLRFDANFSADYYVGFSNSGSPVSLFAIAACMDTGGAFNDGLGDFLEYGSYVYGPKATNNPLSFDGQVCVDPAYPTTCSPNGYGSFWNPALDSGIEIQGDGSGAANTLTPIVNIFSSYAPRLISANPYDPFDRGTPAFPVALPVPLPVKQLVQIAIDNENTGGVTSSDASAAAQVTTGIEVRVRVDELGWNGSSPIKVTGFINGIAHDYVSNQIIGGQLAANTPSFGEPRSLDFQDSTIVQGTGPWFVTINPGNCATAATGACCFGSTSTSNCVTMSQAQCGAPGVGGTYKGNASVCSPNPCAAVATGTCCKGSTCVTGVAASACTGADTLYVAGGTTCNASGNRKTPCCEADFNHVGGITVQDIFDFLGAWFAKNPIANITGNGAGAPTVQSIFDFLSAWFAKGC